MNNRNHRKTLTIDGHLAFIGGLNIAKEYNGDGVNGWRDTHLRIEGPAALAIENVFARSWAQGGTALIGKDLPIVGTRGLRRIVEKPLCWLVGRESFTPPTATSSLASGKTTIRIVSSAPEAIASRILDMYLLAINSAQKSVHITCGYFVPPKILKRALLNAARRGVAVTMILQGETDEPLVHKLSVGFYGSLLKAGVVIYEWHLSVLHAKTIVVDGKWLSVGSANLDGRALFLNYEANACMTSEPLAKNLEAQFKADLSRCKRVDLREWRQRSLSQKTMEVIMSPLEGQF